MNERIKELWDLSRNPSGRGHDEQKFAELIVRECIEQCSKALVEHTGQPSVTHNYAVGLCQDNIKDHFGVES